MDDIHRINALRAYTGLNWRELANKLGLRTPQTFTDIRSGRHGISSRLANRICDAFPELRREWVTFGSGEMKEAESEAVPVGSIPMEYEPSVQHISLHEIFPSADLAVRNTSDSMVEYPVGCVLILREVRDLNLLVPGANYLVDTDEFSVVKRVQSGSTPTRIALYSSNEAQHPDGKMIYEAFEIEMDSVRRMYAVMGYVMRSSEINRR